MYVIKGGETQKPERIIHMTKCLHPRIALRLMTEFLSAACDLTYNAKKENGIIYLYSDADKEKDPTIQSYPMECVIRKGDYFATYGDEDDTLYFTYNYEELDSLDIQILKIFLSEHFPNALDYHFIVFTLLHELGHNETRHLLKNYDRQKELEKISNLNSPMQSTLEYFMLPDEILATNWAAEWLQNENNQRIAKAFEEKFLACFE
jgi:hypothetical protein